jgi:hypothetical protein
MSYLRTQLATDFVEPSNWWQRLTSIDTANPSYRGKYHLVRSWLIEFDEVGAPSREIALGGDGAVLFAGPSEVDYGFWLDTNMRQSDFVGEPVTKEFFEQMWAASCVVAP